MFCFVFLSAPSFFVFAALTQFCLFACLAPTNSVILWSVPVHLQPLAVSFCALVIHALGDAISPVLIGAMLDFTHGNWRFSGIAFSSVLIISSVLWFIAWQFQRRKLRRY